MKMFRLFVALAALASISPAFSQWQTPLYSVPIGRGSGATGFDSVPAGTSGLPLAANGPSAKPSYQALPIGGPGISGLAGGVATFLGAPTSANLRAAVTDETGTGVLVFSNSPALTGVPTAPTALPGTNTTQIATTAFVQATLTPCTSLGAFLVGTGSVVQCSNITGTQATVTGTFNVTGEQTYSVSPTGNPTGGPVLTTYASLNAQGTTIKPNNREFLANIGLNSTTGSGIIDTVNDGKVALYVGIVGNAGTGSIWAINPLITMMPGSGSTYNAQTIEIDFNNLNADRGAADGAAGLVPPAAYGLAISGASTFGSIAAISINGSSVQWHRGISIAAGVTDSSYQDVTSSTISLDVRGTHTYGLDLKNGTFAYPIRLANQTSIAWRNPGDSADQPILTLDSNNNVLYAATGFAGSHFWYGANVAPATDGVTALGGATNRWTTVHAKGLKLYGATSGNVNQVTQAVAGTPTITWGNASGTPAVTVSAPLALSTTTGNLTITGAAGQVLAGATPAFTATPTLGVAGSAIGTLALAGNTSGTVTITPQAAAGTATFTLPNASGTPAISVPSPLSLSAVTGAVTWAGLTIGDILYADTTTSMAKLADVATGNALISGGVGVAPSWGKIGISTHVSGLGTGVATFLGTPSSANLAAAVTDETGSGALVFATAPTFTTSITGTVSGTYFSQTIGRSDHPGSPPYFNAVANYQGANSAGSPIPYQQITNVVDVETAGAESGHTCFATYQAGVVGNRFCFGAGVAVGNILTPGSGSLLAAASIKSQGATDGIGYATGAGGTVTQATSKATAVTLNTVTGTITLNNAALAAATIVSFTLNDSAIASTDYIGTAHESGGTTGAYSINCRATGAGTAACDVRNNTAGSLSEAIVIRFWVHKSVNSWLLDGDTPANDNALLDGVRKYA